MSSYSSVKYGVPQGSVFGPILFCLYMVPLPLQAILASLHWLHICWRIDFKMNFKALHGLSPSYISEMLVPYCPTRTLRSSGKDLLTIPESQLAATGDRYFTVLAPKLWNALPEQIRLADLVTFFNSLIKTHLFIRVFFVT